jgi:hypothetical protein
MKPKRIGWVPCKSERNGVAYQPCGPSIKTG